MPGRDCTQRVVAELVPEPELELVQEDNSTRVGPAEWGPEPGRRSSPEPVQERQRPEPVIAVQEVGLRRRFALGPAVPEQAAHRRQGPGRGHVVEEVAGLRRKQVPKLRPGVAEEVGVRRRPGRAAPVAEVEGVVPELGHGVPGLVPALQVWVARI